MPRTDVVPDSAERAGAIHRGRKLIGARYIRIDDELGNGLSHGLDFLAAEKIVEHLDQLDFPGRQAHAGQPDEGVEIGPADRLDREAGPAPGVEAAERRPDVLELQRERRRFELGLDLGAPLRLERLPLEEALEDVAIGNAVLDRRQREILFGERPQLVAEG